MSWLVPASGCIGFLMAWAIGAQDVANALGTSVGKQYPYPSFFETCGHIVSKHRHMFEHFQGRRL